MSAKNTPLAKAQRRVEKAGKYARYNETHASRYHRDARGSIIRFLGNWIPVRIVRAHRFLRGIGLPHSENVANVPLTA